MKFHKLFLALLLIFMIGAVSAGDVDNFTCDDANALAQQDNAKIIYVNDTGDDTYEGSAESPYATIGRAISDVSSSDNAIIYLSEGRFGSNSDSGLDINLNHQLNCGNLKLIGAGTDKTFIDGRSSSRFAVFDKYTNITLKDLTFIDFRENDGGTISTKGILNVENCIFKNSCSVGVRGGAICAGEGDFRLDDDSIQSLSVKNCQFINCSVNLDESIYECQGGGAIFAGFYNVTFLDNNSFVDCRISKKTDYGIAVNIYRCDYITVTGNRFINLTGYQDASIYIDKDACEPINNSIINNTFINCFNPSEDSSVVHLFIGSYFLKNNTFINSSNSMGCIHANSANVYYLQFHIQSGEMEFGDWEFNNGIKIPVNVTDDNGNRVWINEFKINLESKGDSYSSAVYPRDEVVTLKLNRKISNGVYNLTVQYNYPDSVTTEVLTTLRVNISDNYREVYVSPNGSDANSGNRNHPFKTIQHAIDAGFDESSDVIVHLLKGTYSGEGNVELNIANLGNLQIIGEEYGKTVIDGTDAEWFLDVSTTQVTFENITFTNGKSTSRHLISGGTLKNCIVSKNNVSSESKFVIYTANLVGITYDCNYGRIMQLSPINNSNFTNNEFIGLNEGGIIFTSSQNVVIENCKFINNTATIAGVFYAGLLTSKNSYYENNRGISIGEMSAGVIYTSSGSSCTFENDVFKNNSAYKCGVIGWNYDSPTGVYASPKFYFTGCKFIANRAEEGGVTIIKFGSFTDCEFINNSADYGGAISLLPFVKGLSVLELNNVNFTNNAAKYKGSDIYLAPKTSVYNGKNYIYPIDLTIDFKDLNTTYLADELVANITGPYGAKIGGSTLYFKLNGEMIGSSEIADSVVTFNHVGFENGKYDLAGEITFQSPNTIVNKATVNVDLSNLMDNVTVWVSTEGSDQTGNGSMDNPFKSIAYAVSYASRSSRNILINMGEGHYFSDLNTALILSSKNNITLMGSSINKTVIDGENLTYFATITSGSNRVVISNLTLTNMLPDNCASRIISPNAPITVGKDANLVLDYVEVNNNHGGEAIIVNYGNLIINNSIFKKNGFTNSGIASGGNISIYSTSISDNFEQMGLITSDCVTIKDSVISNVFNYYPSYTAGGLYTLIMGDTLIIENTKISNDGDNSSLESFGLEKNDKIVPAVSIESINIIMNNCSMITDYKSPIDINHELTTVPRSTFLSAFGYLTEFKNVSVENSTFEKFKYLWAVNTGEINILSFNGCYFNNLTNIARSCTLSENSIFSFNNSVFNNVNPIINRDYYSHRLNPDIDFNNNYWGNNSQPVIRYIDRNQVLLENIPKTWIILTEDEGLCKFKVTDGENITLYEGTLPAKISYIADEKGNAIPIANINGNGYPITTDENGNLMINTSAEPINNIEPLVPVGETVFASDMALTKGESVVFMANFTDYWGLPLKNTNVSFVTDNGVINATTDINGTASFTIDFNTGIYMVTVTNPVTGESISRTISVTTTDTISADNVTSLYNDASKFSATITDQYGTPLNNVNIVFKVSENNITKTTDVNGTATFTIDFSAGSYNVTITNPVTGQVTTRLITVNPLATKLTANKVTTVYNVAKNLIVTLKDANGNAIANAKITINLNGKATPVTTDKNGQAKLSVNLPAKTYTATITYNGDNNHVKSTTTAKIVVNKATPKLTAKKATFKAKKKTKKYSITLKDNKGKVIKKAKVTLKVKGKTYKATTNNKGKATFKITKLTKKGKHKATIKYAGNNNFKAVTKTIKYITIK